MKPADLLVEIGTEELPPKALRGLMDAFAANLGAAIDEARLARGAVNGYASPRRLAVIVDELAASQDDRRLSRDGARNRHFLARSAVQLRYFFFNAVFQSQDIDNLPDALLALRG